MSRNSVQQMTVVALVQRFEVIALEQSMALDLDETTKYNRLYDQMEEIEEELRSRDGDQRKVLLPLYDHANAHVQLKAALATLAIDPESARKVLQDISDRNEYPEAASARSMMRSLDEGTYTPV